MSSAAVDAYLAKVPQGQRKTLAELRATLRRLLPGAEEGLAYGMPCFKVDGKGVAGFAAFREHCTYFPMSGAVIGSLGQSRAAYRVSKGGVQFAPDAALPAGLVKKLVKARLQELSSPPATGKGPARSYYDDGVLRSKGGYRAGKMHGQWEFYRRDGSVMRTGRFEDGRQVGVWRTWDRSGRVVKETAF